MAILIQRASNAETKYEYGCDLRRLYPWPEVVDPIFWGSAIATVRPGEATTPHDHDEDETFIVLSGEGGMRVNDDIAEVRQGDVIFLPRGSHHSLANASRSEPLVFLTIFWGSPEARSTLLKVLTSVRADSSQHDETRG